MDRTDAKIVSSSQIGDPAAFVELVWRHASAVHGYLCRRTDRQLADDLLGEVFVQAFKSRANYDDRSRDARPWLYGIARNVLRAHWRASARPQPRIEAAISDPWSEVDEQLDAQSRRGELERALAQLTDDEREILLLVAWERLSASEIATALAIPQGTVRSRLHRARAVMRKHVAVPSAILDNRMFWES
jgi:RNA polymerase sigma-70 factor (ECF subfamily)